MFSPIKARDGVMIQNTKAAVKPNKVLTQGCRKMGYCPVVGGFVPKYEKRKILISGGQVSWWHCRQCGGWHLTMGTEEQ